MTRLRAVMRRLDPWAALLLGGLLAMGVVILLATSGPWQRVVGKEPPVRLETPAPDDVAVFVMAGRSGSCSGVVWLHADAGTHGLTAVVVSPSVSGFSPTDGFAPVGDIADGAGPGVAADALGGALGVSMDAWIALDRESTDLAVQAMMPVGKVKPSPRRYRAVRSAWRGRGDARATWATQFDSLRIALPQVPFDQLGVVAFSNYVLGFGFVRSDLTLQGAASLGEALRDVDRDRVEVRAAPVVIERCRGGEVWHADASKLDPLRQSLAMSIRPPETGRLFTVRGRVARVLVVSPSDRDAAMRYSAQVRRSIARSAGSPVEVRLVWGTDVRLAFRMARELDRRPALAVLVAPPSSLALPAAEKVYATLRSRRQQAVASGPLAGADDQSGGETVAAAVRASKLPVSWLPEEEANAAAGDGAAAGADMTAAAEMNVQTLVRACWPGALAPGLGSTALGLAFVEARHTGVGVVSPSGVADATLLERLRLWGFPAARLDPEDGGWQPPDPGPLLYYRPGAKVAAAALADDLGLPSQSVVRADDCPRELAVVLDD